MGVNFTQYCMVGFCVDGAEIYKVHIPAEWESQPRYNTKTGEVTHVEKVLVKEEVANYELLGFTNSELEWLGADIAESHKVDYFYDHEINMIYIGRYIGETTDYGRVDLINDEISMKDLLACINEVEGIFPDMEISLMFMKSV